MKHFIKKHTITLIFVTILFLSSVGLMSCSTLPPDYDNTEFDLMANIKTKLITLNENCDKEHYITDNIDKLRKEVLIWRVYTETLPNHEQLNEISIILFNDIDDVIYNYGNGYGSTEYCNIKFELMREKMKRALIAYGKLKWTS